MIKKILTQEQLDQAANIYKTCGNLSKTTKQLDFKIDPSTLSKLFKENGIAVKEWKREWNFNFFAIPNEINSYWAGFALADAHVSQRSIGSFKLNLKLSVKDKEHLENFCNDIGLDREVKMATYRGYSQCQIWLESPNLGIDLLQYGVYPRKSYEFIEPTIPDEFLPHFLRGLFDGDGCVSVVTYDGIMNAKLGMVGHFDLLQWVKEKLIYLGFSRDIRVVRKRENTSDPRYKFASLELNGGKEGLIQGSEILKCNHYPNLQRKWSKIDEIKSYIAAIRPNFTEEEKKKKRQDYYQIHKERLKEASRKRSKELFRKRRELRESLIEVL